MHCFTIIRTLEDDTTRIARSLDGHAFPRSNSIIIGAWRKCCPPVKGFGVPLMMRSGDQRTSDRARGSARSGRTKIIINRTSGKWEPANYAVSAVPVLRFPFVKRNEDKRSFLPPSIHLHQFLLAAYHNLTTRNSLALLLKVKIPLGVGPILRQTAIHLPSPASALPRTLARFTRTHHPL